MMQITRRIKVQLGLSTLLIILAGCAAPSLTTPTPPIPSPLPSSLPGGMPSPSGSSSPSMPSPSGGSSGSSMPSLPSPGSSGGGSPGSAGGSSGASSDGSGSSSGGGRSGTGLPGGAGTSGGDSTVDAGQPSGGDMGTGGTPTDLEVLEPEPETSTASADGSSASGGEGGAAGGASGASGGASGSTGGGSAGGGLDGELNRSIEIFETGVQQQIIIIASSSPGGDGDGEFESVGGGQGGGGVYESAQGGPLVQTGAAPELVIIEGDISQLPESSGSNTQADGNSGVVDPDDQGEIEGPRRQGDNKVQKIVIANIPDDVGDGSDDDVVARQIREAAMNEQDPALREKLWEEYRNYKDSLKRRRF